MDSDQNRVPSFRTMQLMTQQWESLLVQLTEIYRTDGIVDLGMRAVFFVWSPPRRPDITNVSMQIDPEMSDEAMERLEQTIRTARLARQAGKN